MRSHFFPDVESAAGDTQELREKASEPKTTRERRRREIQQPRKSPSIQVVHAALVYEANAKVRDRSKKITLCDPARSRAPTLIFRGASKAKWSRRSSSPAPAPSAPRFLEAASPRQRFLCGSCPHLRPQAVVPRS